MAGKGKGMSDTSTRSGLLWEVERILTELKEKPQMLLMENVPQVHSEDNKEDFKKWILRLEELGYKNYWQDLIATDYGIPQTRNRCFMVSVLGDYSYSFPPKQELKLKLKDMLEDNCESKYFLSDKQIESLESGSYNASKPSVKLETTDKGLFQTLDTMSGGNRQPLVRVDKKYYLSDKMINCFMADTQMGKTTRKERFLQNINRKNQDVANSLTTLNGQRVTDTFITNKSLKETLEQNEIDDTCYIDTYNKKIDKEKSGTITTGVSFRNNTFLAIKNATKKGYLEATEGDGVDISARMKYHRGTVQKEKSQSLTRTGGGRHRGGC